MLPFKVRSTQSSYKCLIPCHIAIGRDPFALLDDLDAVMRGIGWMRDNGFAPAWGPGRHGPGDNVYAYYIAPFGPVIEYSTAVEKVPADYRTGEPDDWTWPEDVPAAMRALPAGHGFQIPENLFRKITDEERADWQQKFAGVRG